jgi:hypothetical protein
LYIQGYIKKNTNYLNLYYDINHNVYVVVEESGLKTIIKIVMGLHWKKLS